jgi:hypothetical protein
VRVDRERVAQDRLQGVLLGEPVGERAPRPAGVSAAVWPEPASGSAAEDVRFERQDEHGVGIVGMNRHAESEIGGDSLADVLPALSEVFAAVDPAVVLQEQPLPPGAQRGRWG